VRPKFEYGRKYYVSNYFKRNKQIANYSDRVVAFVSNSKNITSGTLSTLKYAEKLNKKSIIID
jgi:predicted Rossmann fold nucleotide-binding protein DprA/Smf involved in DNA uptake